MSILAPSRYLVLNCNNHSFAGKNRGHIFTPMLVGYEAVSFDPFRLRELSASLLGPAVCQGVPSRAVFRPVELRRLLRSGIGFWFTKIRPRSARQDACYDYCYYYNHCECND